MWPEAGAAFSRAARVFTALIELNLMIKPGAFQCFGFQLHQSNQPITSA
jgi:hypothetical protein